jgi:taurine dioxygenase
MRLPSTQLSPLSPHVGMEIRGFDARCIDEGSATTLAALLLRHVVLVIRGQELRSQDHVEFSRFFGELESFPGRPGDLTPDAPSARFIFPVSNHSTRGYKGVGMYWHTDGYFYTEPTAVSMLRAVELPPRGGDTLFAHMGRAYDTLPVELKSQVRDLSAEARPAPDVSHGTGLFGRPAASGVTHPLVRQHPLTGRETLYLNLRNIASIPGLTRSEMDDLLVRLAEHLDSGDFTYRHRWMPGDLVIWDNAGGAHKATAAASDSLRLMERTTIVGTEFFQSAFWKSAEQLAAMAA